MNRAIRLGAVALGCWLSGLAVAAAALITPAHEATLEGWLGQGDLTFTQVYALQAGHTPEDFHTAVDGKGATFVLMMATLWGSTPAPPPVLIGGYNPQSWATAGTPGGNGYNLTPDPADRTAFIFNLSTSVIQRQRLSQSPNVSGDHQTLNLPTWGPAFGAGRDLGVSNFGPAGGSAYGRSYGSPPEAMCGGQSEIGGPNIFGLECHQSFFTVGAMEVYTIAPVTTVPDPTSTLPLLTLAGAALAAARRHIH
jgi:hypothetical protein